VDDLKGGDRFVNADMLRDTLSGTPGAVADALALNAGTALHACGVAPESVAQGVTMALVRACVSPPSLCAVLGLGVRTV
jgi:anthranilate phosphoribosyltransferase